MDGLSGKRNRIDCYFGQKKAHYFNSKGKKRIWQEVYCEKWDEYFKKFDMESRVQEFEVSSATVELAAEALHCEPYFLALFPSVCYNEISILIQFTERKSTYAKQT